MAKNTKLPRKVTGIRFSGFTWGNAPGEGKKMEDIKSLFLIECSSDCHSNPATLLLRH